MSFEAYDVEHADTLPFLRWTLGLIAVISGTLAIIGWPLPIASGRYDQGDTWTTGLSLVHDWLVYDGWRMSGSSWLWAGIAVGNTISALQVNAGTGHFGIKQYLRSLVPAGALLTMGPVWQYILGVPWSNYSPTRTHLSTVVIYIVFLIIVTLALAVISLVTRVHKHSQSRKGKQVNGPMTR